MLCRRGQSKGHCRLWLERAFTVAASKAARRLLRTLAISVVAVHQSLGYALEPRIWAAATKETKGGSMHPSSHEPVESSTAVPISPSSGIVRLRSVS